MTEALNSDKLRPSPTLNTIIMVEDTIQNSPDSVITIAKLKKALPRQVNHYTLMTILEYLEKSNKIVVGLRGITWIHNTNQDLRNVAIYGREI